MNNSVVKVKLGDVLDVKRGTSLSGNYFSETGKYIRLTLGNFCYPQCGWKKNTSKKDLYYIGSFRDDFLMKKGDIITPLTEQVRGLLGNTATIPEDNIYIQSGDIGKVIANENVLDKRFSYYLLSSPVVKGQLAASSQQTKIRHTSPDKIKECYGFIPKDIAEQKKIASLLDSINNKIILNNKTNTLLQKQTKLIYDYWFNQFEFQNDDGKPYKSSGGKMIWNEELKREIPNGWKVCNLKDVISKEKYAIVDGPFGTQMKIEDYIDNGIPVYEMEQLNGLFIVSDFKHFISEEKYETIKRSTVKNGDIVISKTGTLGLLGIVNSNFEKGILVSRLAKITPDESKIGKYTLLIYLQELTDCGYWIQKSGGSTMPILNNTILENVPVLMPSDDLYIRFENICKPLFSQIFELQKENQKLALLRDFLLPMLMNGQATISD